ncbi:vacuolar iron transporter homolog 5-like [Ipomoea triloba]|uniref:vacuolar iron transporter homolog 5-like n=1 Tax=Ipomoea triloba TaxID=35885 RepID=UPI00125E1E1A|nr:vacuolar iron transporter homolog 5-like [Ipomoea triloba]
MAPSSSSSSPQCAEDAENPVKQLQRGQWLRAAILGANDGLMSTASLMIGVGAAKEDQRDMILAGLAGALAGACSMAVGEFVSVSTQRDIEKSVLRSCSLEKEEDGDGKIKVEIVTNSYTQSVIQKPTELDFYQQSVIQKPTDERNSYTQSVIQKSTELPRALPNPYKAAGASGLAFLCGSLPPLLTSMVAAPNNIRIIMIVALASVALAVFGGAGAYFGGSPVRKSAGRVLVGGWISMAITYGMLRCFDKDSKGDDDD